MLDSEGFIDDSWEVDGFQARRDVVVSTDFDLARCADLDDGDLQVLKVAITLRRFRA